MTGAVAPQILALCAIAFVPAIGEAFYFRGKIPWSTPVPPSEMASVATVDRWGDEVLWVDARPDAEFSADHIPNAFSLNEDRWNELLPGMLQHWTPGKKVVVYCSSQSCNLSRAVAQRLKKEVQLPDVYILEGGWEAWIKTHPR